MSRRENTIGALALAAAVTFCGEWLAPGFTTNTITFGYTNRDALLADGWSFWATNNGAGRNTEITDTNAGAVVQYAPPDNPDVLRIPVDVGSTFLTPNDSRNSLFRALATNWVSVRLALAFAPTNYWQQVNLEIYQDDDNHLSLVDIFGGSQRVALTREAAGFYVLNYHIVNLVPVTATNLSLRFDREPVTDRISSFYSVDGTNWLFVGQFSQAFPNPRLGITTGYSDAGRPNCDLVRLEIVTDDAPMNPALILQPQHLVFNGIAGQPCTNIQVLNAVLQCRQTGPVHWSLANSAPDWLSTSLTSGDTPGSCDVSVNSTGLAAGVYQGTLTCSAPGATSAVAAVTLIVNPASRVKLATWQGAKAGAMSVSVDDSYPTAFDDLSTNGLRGTYVMWQDSAPAFYPAYYQAGMELGCHTLSHPCAPVSAPAIRGEIEGNLAGLLATTPVPPSQVNTLVWPCGVSSIEERVAASDYFLAARGYMINLLEDPKPYDFMNIKSFNSRHPSDQWNPSAPPTPTNFIPVVDAAIAQGKWLNLVLHDINQSDGAIGYSVGKDIWVAPIGVVTKYILQRDRTVITDYVENPSYIQFGVCRLALEPSAIRSFEPALGTNDVLTFQVDVSDLEQVSAVYVNGIQTSFTTNSGVLSFNALVTTNLQSVILSLQPNELIVLADNQTRTYGAANPTLTGTLVGVQAGDDITASYSTSAAVGIAVGTYPIEPGLNDPGGRLTNYSVSIVNGTITVTPAALSVVASNASRAYGYYNPPLTGTVSGLQNNDNITADYSTTAAVASSVGAYSIVPALADPDGKLGNYAVSTHDGTLSVTPASLLVSADNLARPYGVPNPPLTGKVFGVPPATEDSMSLTCATTATISSPVGTYDIIPSLLDPGNRASNYNVILINGTLSIVPVNMPIILSTTKVGDNDVVITWSSLSNGVYRVQSKPTQDGTTWTDLAPDVTATDSTTSFTDHSAIALQRFYRVQVLSTPP